MTLFSHNRKEVRPVRKPQLSFTCEQNRSSNQTHQWHYFHMLERKFIQSENHSSVRVLYQVSCRVVYHTAVLFWEGALHDSKKYLKISWSRSYLEAVPIKVNSKIVESYEWGCHLYTLFLGCCYKFTSEFEKSTDTSQLCQYDSLKNSKQKHFRSKIRGNFVLEISTSLPGYFLFFLKVCKKWGLYCWRCRTY